MKRGSNQDDFKVSTIRRSTTWKDAIPTYLLSLASFGGGFLGFKRAGSIKSLISGAGVGTLYGLSGWLIQDDQARKGHIGGLVTSALLAGSMAPKFLKTLTIFPAGTFTALGVFGLFYHARRVISPVKNPDVIVVEKLDKEEKSLEEDRSREAQREAKREQKREKERRREEVRLEKVEREERKKRLSLPPPSLDSSYNSPPSDEEEYDA
eukprot:TRINITY_DN22730_c0_g1_i1.p1 TRINITY_DN22730_c0_g1~~TRINITY_DN22730_c0_g1_i1.p1  ORF type:complete len:209 (+),score=82.91 TRINITY_DN22730_c0_g1_i1:123-749(+)